MEKVSQILAEFRLNFSDDQKSSIKLNSRSKCSKSILLVDSLLNCSQQQIDQFLSPSLDSLLKLSSDSSHDVRQAASDALNRLTSFLPENLLTKLRYLLFKHLQHSVNQPERDLLRLKVLLKRFSNLSDSIKPIKSSPFAQYLVPIMNLLLASNEESLQLTLSQSTTKIIESLGHVFTESDSRDLQTTIITKLRTKGLSLSGRQCGSEVLVSISRNNSKMFSSSISILSDGLNTLNDNNNMETLPATLMALRLLINELEKREFVKEERNINFHDLFEKLMNLSFNTNLNYMALLSVLELSIVLLRGYSDEVMKELNPLTGEESISSSTGSRRLKVFFKFSSIFSFYRRKGKNETGFWIITSVD
jgi:hypothetical protein